MVAKKKEAPKIENEIEHFEFIKETRNILTLDYDINWTKLNEKFLKKWKIYLKWDELQQNIIKLWYYRFLLYFNIGYRDYETVFNKVVNKK